MFKDKTFQVALFVSFLLHVVALYRLPQINVNIHKSVKQMEVTYHQLKNLPRELRVSTKKIESDKQIDKIHIVKAPRSISSFFKDKFQMKNFKLIQNKPKIAKQVTAPKKRIISSKLESKMDNPLYKTYYEKIRDKIKKQAYKNYTKFEEGEVYLSFIISSDGLLKDTNLFKDKSSANDFLQDIALSSVKKAAPYPEFPPDLNFPQLSFNVIISFELGD